MIHILNIITAGNGCAVAISPGVIAFIVKQIFIDVTLVAGIVIYCR